MSEVNSSPNEYNVYDPSHREVPPMFRVGDPTVVNEFFDGKSHVLAWNVVDQDKLLASVAGWDQLDPKTYSDGHVATIEIPEGTRNVSSVLGGMEAWPGEKRGLILRLADYTAEVHRLFGEVDIAASINHMGVEQGEGDDNVFFTPPHKLSADPETVANWLSFTRKDLETVLNGDPNKEELVSLFKKKMVQAGLGKK